MIKKKRNNKYEKIIYLFFGHHIIYRLSYGKDISDIEKIKIDYLEWDLFTYIRVDCDKLESYSGQLSTITTRDSIFCGSLYQDLHKLKVIGSDHKPDVRIKLIVSYRKKDPEIVCIGNNNIIEINGQIIQYNDDLVKLVRDFIDNAVVKN